MDFEVLTRNTPALSQIVQYLDLQDILNLIEVFPSASPVLSSYLARTDEAILYKSPSVSKLLDDFEVEYWNLFRSANGIILQTKTQDRQFVLRKINTTKKEIEDSSVYFPHELMLITDHTCYSVYNDEFPNFIVKMFCRHTGRLLKQYALAQWVVLCDDEKIFVEVRQLRKDDPLSCAEALVVNVGPGGVLRDNWMKEKLCAVGHYIFEKGIDSVTRSATLFVMKIADGKIKFHSSIKSPKGSTLERVLNVESNERSNQKNIILQYSKRSGKERYYIRLFQVCEEKEDLLELKESVSMKTEHRIQSVIMVEGEILVSTFAPAIGTNFIYHMKSRTITSFAADVSRDYMDGGPPVPDVNLVLQVNYAPRGFVLVRGMVQPVLCKALVPHGWDFYATSALLPVKKLLTKPVLTCWDMVFLPSLFTGSCRWERGVAVHLGDKLFLSMSVRSTLLSKRGSLNLIDFKGTEDSETVLEKVSSSDKRCGCGKEHCMYITSLASKYVTGWCSKNDNCPQKIGEHSYGCLSFVLPPE